MTRSDATRALAAVSAALAVACAGRGPEPLHASGHIEATEVRIAAKVPGKLLELPSHEGDAVAAGQLMARLDASDAEHQLAQARGELAAADAHLRLLEAGTRSEDIDRAAALLARDQADLDGARLDLKRLEGLADRGTATLKARDDARTRAAMLERGVAADRAQLDALEAGPRPEEIEQARGQRDAAAAAVAAAAQRVADATVAAPLDGVVTERIAEPGEVLAAGAPLLVLTDLAHPWLNVYVDEPALAHIHLGDTARVKVDGRADAFPGRVTFVSPVAEFTPKNVQTPEERAKLVFRIKIGLDNPSGVFKPGMPADAYFEETGTGGRAPGSGVGTSGSRPPTSDSRAPA
ncbi:MAG TPA: efflux RND transporter periplasmic adaptor subunit [Thermoanaerobaculaceae bacterium]|nr:efflux RND transporter periplasmic adaptor subunit [Thermoanaerobaculaceae bacterium]